MAGWCGRQHHPVLVFPAHAGMNRIIPPCARFALSVPRPRGDEPDIYGNVPILRTVEYQLAGAGKSRQRAVFDPREIGDIREWLTKHLGELCLCDVETPRAAPAATDDLAAWESGIMPRSVVAVVVGA